MIRGKSVLAIIPARGGSKGVKRKNIRSVAGKPLIAWTIEEAKKSKYIDRIILSSENQEIVDVAKSWGCEVPFLRPAELALDTTSGIDPVLHAIENLPAHDYIVLLQPTSPLRLADDIDNCIELCVERESNVTVSLTEVEKSPYWMYSVESDGKIKPLIDINHKIIRRQDLPKAFMPNGAVYVAKPDWLFEKKQFLTEETLAYLMPPERSLDIDTEIDMKIAEWVLANRNL